MRLLFLVLLLANVAMSAYIWLAAGQDPGEKRIRILEIAPERIKPVGRGRRLPPQPKPASAAPQAAACLEWGLFAGPELDRAEAAIAALELPQTPARRSTTEASGYWVYIPPLTSTAAVEKKLGELKDLGVNEFFVVQDASQWQNAISLGIFKTEQAADAYLAALRRQGVRSAIAERRENFLKQYTILVREPDESAVAKLAEAQRQFPGTEIRATACPPQEPGTRPLKTSAIRLAARA